MQTPVGFFPQEFFILLGIALFISATGFIRLVYFVSVGYAFSIAAMMAASFFLFGSRLTLWTSLHGAILILYGLRLGIFLVSREGSPSYRAELAEVQQRNQGVSLVKRLFIWAGVSVLYVCMASPAVYHFQFIRDGGNEPLLPLTIAGIVVMLSGIGLEAFSDFQKSAFKKQNPKRFCDRGIFAFVRCPNYLGEILFWTGALLTAAPVLQGFLPWALALLGYVCIVLIMMGSTKRLEQKQETRYGNDSEYHAYIKKVPVLFPFVPVYTLKNIKVYLE